MTERRGLANNGGRHGKSQRQAVSYIHGGIEPPVVVVVWRNDDNRVLLGVPRLFACQRAISLFTFTTASYKLHAIKRCRSASHGSTITRCIARDTWWNFFSTKSSTIAGSPHVSKNLPRSFLL